MQKSLLEFVLEAMVNRLIKIQKDIEIIKDNLNIQHITSETQEVAKQAETLATDPQKKYLKDLGVEIPEGLTKLEAGHVLDEIKKLQGNNNQTLKQSKPEENEEFPDY